MDTNTDDRFETVEAAAEALSISRAMLYKLIAQGKLNAVKLGGATRISRAERQRFMASLPSKISTGTYATRVMRAGNDAA